MCENQKIILILYLIDIPRDVKGADSKDKVHQQKLDDNNYNMTKITE